MNASGCRLYTITPETLDRSRRPRRLADPEVLRRWSERRQAPACANLLAIIGGVWSHAQGAAAGVRAINAAIEVALG